ncbi:MAG: hypothetical protein IID51_13890 [Proteobacteria bacterium]|nr:hypothetical protein [Pseudomonadota bacterium]
MKRAAFAVQMKSPTLMPMRIAMADLRHDRYAPFDSQTGLFHAFGALRSEADVIAFANRFGPLGADLSTAIVNVVREEPWKTSIEPYWAEPIDLWLAEACAMARVVSLWELIQARDRSVFQVRLTRSAARLRIKTGLTGDRHIAKDWILAKKAEKPDLFRRISEKDEKDWPRLLLEQWVNRGTGGRTDFGLGLSEKSLAAAQTPRGLIGALWQQATLAIDGHVDFLQCRQCRDWFGISAEHARPEKLFCSNACRMRAYRKRKKGRKESALT